MQMNPLGCAGTIVPHCTSHMQGTYGRSCSGNQINRTALYLAYAEPGPAAAIVPSPVSHTQDRLRMQAQSNRSEPDRGQPPDFT